MRKLILLVMLVLCSVISLTSAAQSKGTSPKKNSTSVKKAPTSTSKHAKADQAEDVPPPQEQVAISFDTTAAPNDTFTKDIMELLLVTGALENDVKAAEQSLKQSIGSSTDPNATAFYDRFMYEMREGRARRWMTNLYVRTYRQNFTQNEVQELKQFYKTSLGKKVIEATPQISQTVMMEGQKIGAYLGQTIMTEILQNNK